MMAEKPKYPGIRITTNGNQLVSYYTEARVADGGIFYPITPSTEAGEMYQQAFAEGKLNVFGAPKLAVEAEGEHAAQGGAIAYSVCGRRTVNFTSGQGIVYGVEQYYHAPGKCSTMIVEVAARALTKHALNVHCGHDDIYGALDTGWIMVMAKDAQQAADQALILRRVTELSLTPGMNIYDGFLTSHLERTFYMHESDLIREYLGAPDDIIECPTEAQRALFGPTRRRVPPMIDLKNPVLLGPVQNQEHYMQGVVGRRNNFVEQILPFLEDAYREFARLTGRYYGMVTPYKCDDAETVFLSLGSAAENIDAAVDYLRAKEGARVGSLHLNVIRPFPEAAVVEAVRGKRNLIIIERTDEAMAADNPMARETRTALSKALFHEGKPTHAGIPPITEAEMPRIFTGVYGLGSRDFRPEAILGAYEYVVGRRARTDGKRADDGVPFVVLGIDHPYEVRSDDRPSLLPDNAIAVRLHSIGGWGMITTGKNLGEIIGNLGDYVSQKRAEKDEWGRLKEIIHVSANPKYGSEKKGAPTEYFLVAAPERIRVNCDLRHVNVVLCCDPKAFTHCNPLEGMVEGGVFVWESEEAPEVVWQRIPPKYRREIIEKRIKIYTLPGFDIARNATNQPELQLRMQGNAFLGAFFKVSPFLKIYDIDPEHFREVVHKQYVKRFGRLGEAVVESNMKVMTAGFERVAEIAYGEAEDPDRSKMRGELLLPVSDCGGGGCRPMTAPAGQAERQRVFQIKAFDEEFRGGHGYHQPSTPLSAVGVMAAASGATASKYVARRLKPVFIAENCTQCMDCIAACPDTALPNTAQDMTTVLRTAIRNYVSDPAERAKMLEKLPQIESIARDQMRQSVQAKAQTPFKDIVRNAFETADGFSAESKQQLYAVIEKLPLAYNKVNMVFATREKKEAGSGGIFSIFVSDLCKGCGECATECGEHDALRMVPETEDLNTDHLTATRFFDLLPDTPQKYLGLYDDSNAMASREAALRNHLMVRRNYEALVSGDGACAGCGEKSVLRALATLTEAYMRPLYHAKADRLREKAARLEAEGAAKLAALKARSPEQHALFLKSVAHLLMGLGGDSDADTDKRIAAHGPISDADLVNALTTVLRQEAFNHKELQALDGRLANGMSVMAMGAHTGCNTVYGSTPPNNPHPYPWMNSLFQDGATISWIIGESFIMDHARRSVIPERLVDRLLGSSETVIAPQDYFTFTRFSDTYMTDQEIRELPKVWALGGDGGMGDIGYQNVSKVVLQNRPNVKMLMMDTQVYSNTGGQNSDSTLMLGGSDMNQFGAASQGKLVEKKSVAESFTSGHGSPYVAQVSMANAAKLYRSILEALDYRGTAFLQCYTPCQPEHGVADDVSAIQSKRIRDSRGMPEFVFNPALGETYPESMSVKGNPQPERDWWETTYPGTREPYKYTPAHWCATEARFRRHLKKIKEEQTGELTHLDDMLVRITMDDIVRRRFLDETHRAYVPDFGVYIRVEGRDGKPVPMAISRQMVLFCVERRKAWRLLQSKAGVRNIEYEAQISLLRKFDKGEISRSDLLNGASKLLAKEIEALGGPKAAEHKPAAAAPAPAAK
jgi:pyruvate-ferredoxin/flavodoxin oxidoreductase